MRKPISIFKFRLIPFVAVVILTSLFMVYLLRKPILKNNYAKAKLDIMETLISTPPDQQKARIIQIIDSTFSQKDSTETQ